MKNILTMTSIAILFTSCSWFEESEGRDGAQVRTNPPEPISIVPDIYLKLATYENCEDMQRSVHDTLYADELRRREFIAKRKKWQESRENQSSFSQGNASMPSNNMSSSNPMESSDESADTFTNNQEKGIDEADLVKIGDKSIFVLRSDSISVVDRDSLDERGKLEVEGAQKMFFHKGRLVVMGRFSKRVRRSYNLSSSATPVSNFNNGRYYYENSFESYVQVYEEQESEMPKLVEEFKTKAEYLDSRLQNGKLITVYTSQLPMVDTSSYNHYSEEDLDIPDEPIKVKKGMVHNVPCQHIVKKPATDRDFSMTIISSFDLDAEEIEPLSTSTLGGGSKIYMGPEGLYITKQGLSPAYWGRYEGHGKNYYDSLVISKVRFEGERMNPVVTARGLVMGQTNDQYSFKEFAEQNALAVVTTTSAPLADSEDGVMNLENKGAGRNHLWIVQEEDGKLERRKLIKNFGKPREDVRSVRFTKDKAYVVTFEKTDPLYSFDTSDPLNPVMTGELEIPGFSKYMHPFGEDLIVGVGYAAEDKGDFSLFQGVQVSLFDVSDPANMSRVDNKIHGERGSSTEVTHNPLAFFMDEENATFALPIIELGDSSRRTGASYGHTRNFSGAIFYKIEGDRLSEQARISHYEFIPSDCRPFLEHGQWWTNNSVSQDVNRIYDVDDRYLTISRFGIIAAEKGNPANIIKKTDFNTKNSTCEGYGYHW